jgi:hypothetical protein
MSIAKIKIMTLLVVKSDSFFPTADSLIIGASVVSYLFE